MKKERLILILVSLIFFRSIFFFSIKTAEAAAGKDLLLKLQDKKISELTPSGLLLSFLSQIENSSAKRYLLVSYRYQVLINQKEYLSQFFTLDQPVEIGPAGITSINFPVKINYKYLDPMLLATQKQASCQVKGEMFFQDEKKKNEKLDFNFQIDFPLFHFPEIEFLSLAVRDLTLGGADLSFRFRLKNINQYDLLVQRINLDLRVDGRNIFKGDLPGDKTLLAGEAKVFSIPLLLDFFELGPELKESLSKEQISFNLKVWLEIDSVWGLLAFSLEKQDSVRKEFIRQ